MAVRADHRREQATSGSPPPSLWRAQVTRHRHHAQPRRRPTRREKAKIPPPRNRARAALCRFRPRIAGVRIACFSPVKISRRQRCRGLVARDGPWCPHCRRRTLSCRAPARAKVWAACCMSRAAGPGRGARPLGDRFILLGDETEIMGTRRARQPSLEPRRCRIARPFVVGLRAFGEEALGFWVRRRSIRRGAAENR